MSVTRTIAATPVSVEQHNRRLSREIDSLTALLRAERARGESLRQLTRSLAATLTRDLFAVMIGLNFPGAEDCPQCHIGRPDEVPLGEVVNTISRLPEWGKTFATALGGAMQTAYAGWGKFFGDLRQEMQSLTAIPSQPFMAPPGGADSFPKYQRPGSATPTTPSVGSGTGPAQRHPTAYQMPADTGQAAVQRVHVTFEADVPGRASIKHADTAPMARGPMLSRA